MNFGNDEADDFIDGNFGIVRICTVFELDQSFLEISFANRDAVRDSKEVVVFEFDAGADIAIIVQNFDAGILEFVVYFFGSGDDVSVFHEHWSDNDVEWRNDGGEINPVGIIILFNCGGEYAGHTDTITAHDAGMGVAVGIEIGGAHGVTVFGAEQENVTDFDTAESLEFFAAMRAGVAFLGKDEIGDGSDGEVAAGLDVDEVVIGLVCAANAVVHEGDVEVGVDGELHATGAESTDFCAHDFLDGGIAGHDEVFAIENALKFDFIEIFVTAHEDEDGLGIGEVDEGFDGVFGFVVQESGDFINGMGGSGGDHFLLGRI